MGKLSFRGGIHPLHDRHEGKEPTRGKPIRAYVAKTVSIPMDMHIGAPSKPIVVKGDRVLMGQQIADAVGGIGVPVHSSVSGMVTAVAEQQMLHKKPSLCITIENDGLDEWTTLIPLGTVEEVDKTAIIPAIKAAGICGMGGACFPTHVKLSPPADKKIEVILLNGAECETFLTADFRLMVEQPERIVDGLRLAMRAMDVNRGVICIEDNKPEAIEAMQKAASGRTEIEVVVMRTKYPQGCEKQIITAATGREVPSGGLPMDVGAVVLNVATAAAIADAVTLGRPCIERVTTVTGAVKEPDNLLLRVGTSILDAVEACGGYAREPGKIFFGGSMTGNCAPDDQASITKANNGIVVLDQKEAVLAQETNCIRCGRCIDACPARLNPYQLKKSYLLEKYEEMEKDLHVNDCMVCSACSYICPAHQRLTPAFKEVKDKIAARRASK